MRKPTVGPYPLDNISAELIKLNATDLQTVIQLAEKIRAELPERQLAPEALESLSKELKEIGEVSVSIPITLHFQLKAALYYQPTSYGMEGNEEDWRSRVELGEVEILELGKSTLPPDMILRDGFDLAECLLDHLDDGDVRLTKACSELVAYGKRIDSFQENLRTAADNSELDVMEAFDAVHSAERDTPQSGKRGKKKVGKRKAGKRMPF